MNFHIIRGWSTLKIATEETRVSSREPHVYNPLCVDANPQENYTCGFRKLPREDQREAVDWALIYNCKLKLAMKPLGASHTNRHEAQSKPSTPVSACLLPLLISQTRNMSLNPLNIPIKHSVSCVRASTRRSCRNSLSISPELRLFQGQNGFCFICRPQRSTLHSNDP